MKRMLWVILMMSCGATFISSLFPLYGSHYRLSSLEITILFAVYAAILLPTLLVVGARGNSWGLKRVLRFSIWISIASTLLLLGVQISGCFMRQGFWKALPMELLQVLQVPFY
ncbi:hypothetical protein AB4Z22_24975 [Paenibacillus sp. TAF58]